MSFDDAKQAGPQAFEITEWARLAQIEIERHGLTFAPEDLPFLRRCYSAGLSPIQTAYRARAELAIVRA